MAVLTNQAAREPSGRAPEACDRCPAPGQVVVMMPSGLDLVFCEHHARVYRDVLRRQSLYITRGR